MPEAIIAALPIITAAVGAGGLAISGYELANKPSTSAPAVPQATIDQNAAQTKQNQEASVSQQFPNLQASTGGSLSPDALVALSTILSGQGNAQGIGATTDTLLQKLTGKANPFLVQAGAGGNTTPSPTGLTGATNA
jgi:hypothetical protein